MIEFKKYYRIHCCKTVIRHEWKHHCWNFPERVQTHNWYEGKFSSPEEVEKYIKKKFDEFKLDYPGYYNDGEVVIEKDIDNRCITIKLYRALYRNYIRENNNTAIKRKSKPFFTIVTYYSVCDTMFGYNDSKTWKEEDPWSGWDFEEPWL